MKTITRLSILAITAFSAAFASADSLHQFDDGSTLSFVGGVDIIYDDNIYRQPVNEVSDIRTEMLAGLEISSSPNSAMVSSLGFGANIVRYDTEPLDDVFYYANISSTSDTGVMVSTLYLDYVEEYVSRYDLNPTDDVYGVLVTRDDTSWGGSLKYELSNLTAFKIGLDYSEVDYDGFYDNRDTFTVPATLFYQMSPKIDLTAGARYRETDTDLGIEYTDKYFYVGAIGELFSPVIHADVQIGLQDRQADNSNADTDSASYQLKLIYTGDPKATAYLSVARDYRTSAVNSDTYAFTYASLGAGYEVKKNLSLNAAVVYGESEYEESIRQEDITIFRVGATYTPNDYMTFRAGFYNRNIDGNVVDYKSKEFQVSASLRY